MFSDLQEALMIVPGVNQNPGDTKAVTGDSGDHGITNEKATVEAVTVEDIMDRIPAQSYIIKTDIQKYDCKVYVSSMSIFTNHSLSL